MRPLRIRWSSCRGRPGYARTTYPVLMIASRPLQQSTMASPPPPVSIGEAFWADDSQAGELAAAGLAEYAPDGTTPPAEPPLTVNGVLGFAAGTSNASH